MTGFEYICGEDQLEVGTDDDLDIGLPLTDGGADSDVYRALRKKDGKLLAVKEMDFPLPLPPAVKLKLEELVKEMEILKEENHENIVPYTSCAFHHENVDGQTVMKVYVYSDFLRHDTLETIYQEFKLSERQIGLYTRHILKGIAHLHGKDILHRDIRCGNILVDNEAVCRLKNYGKAKELGQIKDRVVRSISGHEHWMAPEFACGGIPYGKPVDIWSLGCTVLEMLTGQKPFEADGKVSEFEVLKRLRQGEGPTIPEYRYPSNGDERGIKISQTARDFVKICLQMQPELRPTAYNLLEHPFVKPAQGEPVVQTCLRICKELEKNASYSSVVIISSEWLIKWQSNDDKVYAKLLDFGYMKTFETETYSCFENILHSSDGGCSCSDDHAVQSSLDVPPKRVVSHGTSQESGHYEHSTLLRDDASSTSGTEMQDGVNIDDHGTRKFLEETGTSGKENVLTATEVHDSKASSMCSGDCPDIPLIVVKNMDCDASSSSSSGTPVALAVLELRSKGVLYKVSLALSCCVKENQLCIKLSYFKGQIFPSSTKRTVRLRQTRLSISAKVGDQSILLRPVDPGNDRERVCTTGRALWEVKHGTQGKTALWFNCSPGVQIASVVGLSLGGAGMHREDYRVPVTICDKGEPLELVVLKVSHQGSGCFDFEKVLLLQRNIANTYLARGGNITCTDSQADDSRPIILMGKFYLDSSSSDDGHRQRSVEITCCADLDTDYIPDEKKFVDIIQKEILYMGCRKEDWVSLCHSNGTGHVTFKGMVPTNI